MLKNLPSLFFYLLLVFLFSGLVEPCFITNCPRGGKRSSPAQLESFRYKECGACGPNGQGRCFGPDLCCGSLIGCFKRTEETRICGQEDESVIPCMNDAPKCNAVTRGQCVMKNYCCNEQGDCRTDSQCHAPLKPFRTQHEGSPYLTGLKQINPFIHFLPQQGLESSQHNRYAVMRAALANNMKNLEKDKGTFKLLEDLPIYETN